MTANPDGPDDERSLVWYLTKIDVLIVPAIGYYLAFSYHRAYLEAFGIPAIFVRVDVTSLLIFTSAVLGLSTVFYLPLRSFIQLGDTQIGSRRLDFYGGIIVLIVVLRWGLDFSWRSPYVIAILIYLALSIVGDVFASIRAKKRPNVSRPWDMYTRLKQLFGPYFAYVIVLFLGSFLCSAFGTFDAARKVNFVGPKSEPNSVLVAMVDQKAICAFFDPVTKQPSYKFNIIDPSRDAVQFERRAVGPLVFDVKTAASAPKPLN